MYTRRTNCKTEHIALRARAFSRYIIILRIWTRVSTSSSSIIHDAKRKQTDGKLWKKYIIIIIHKAQQATCACARVTYAIYGLALRLIVNIITLTGIRHKITARNATKHKRYFAFIVKRFECSVRATVVQARRVLVSTVIELNRICASEKVARVPPPQVGVGVAGQYKRGNERFFSVETTVPFHRYRNDFVSSIEP